MDRQAYFDNGFVGNHCKAILDKHELLCGVLGPHPKRPKIVRFFKIFHEVKPLIFTKRDLTDSEIDFVKNRCYEFGDFSKYFPDENISRKVHEFVFSVPRFINIHKTIGRYSEEEGESLHNLINQELRRLCGVRDQKLKLKLLHEAQELRGKANRSLLVPKSRLCSVCPPRTFLKAGICPKCKGNA